MKKEECLVKLNEVRSNILSMYEFLDKIYDEIVRAINIALDIADTTITETTNDRLSLALEGIVYLENKLTEVIDLSIAENMLITDAAYEKVATIVSRKDTGSDVIIENLNKSTYNIGVIIGKAHLCISILESQKDVIYKATAGGMDK